MQVGFAKADITPPIGREVPGSLRKKYSSDFHDPLYASAMVVSDGDDVVAIVGIDALSVKRSVVENARDQIEEWTGIAASNVLVGASHTHAGGPTMGAVPGDFADASKPELCERLAQEHATAADPCYLERLSGEIATAVFLANKRREPAVLYAGSGRESSVAFNRRFNMTDGTQATHPGKCNEDIVGPAGPIDDEVGVIGAWSDDGEFLGATVNFALHGTVGCGGISSDWIHFMRETITNAVDTESTVVFVNGACGDVTQIDNVSVRERASGVKWARRIGMKVGAEALKVLAEAEPAPLEPVKARQEIINIPTRDVSEQQYERALEAVTSDDTDPRDMVYMRDTVLLHEHNKWEPEVDCEIQAIQIGPAVFVSNPAEYFCQFGLNIKERSEFPFTWVVELANGCIGYVPTAEAMGPKGGGYEPRPAMSSKLVAEAGRMIEDTSVELTEELTPAQVPPRPTVDAPSGPWYWGASKPEGE